VVPVLTANFTAIPFTVIAPGVNVVAPTLEVVKTVAVSVEDTNDVESTNPHVEAELAFPVAIDKSFAIKF
jgi:hypothetical protein